MIGYKPVNTFQEGFGAMALHLLTPQFLTTFGVFAASAGTAAVMNFKARKPRQTLTPPRVAPQTVIIIAMAVALLACIHLGTLLRATH